jgi:hypothetical protein
MINDGINDGDVSHEVLTSMALMVIIMPMKVIRRPDAQRRERSS